jgi:hypothetical protein
VGVGIGYGAAALVEALSPPLTASTDTGTGGPGGAGDRFAHSAAHTVLVHLPAPVTLDAVALAVVLPSRAR